MTISIHPKEAPELWHGVSQWLQLDELRWQPWRIPQKLAGTVFNPHFERQAQIPAGTVVRLKTDASAIRLIGSVPSPYEIARDWPGTWEQISQDACVDVLVDGKLHERIVFTASTHHMSDRHVAHKHIELADTGLKDIEVWLPHAQFFALETLELMGASFYSPTPNRLKWATYGSSITQCAAANGPSETWPALVSRSQDLEVLALGMGGQCHLDDAVLRTLIAAQPDFLSVSAGINVYGRGSFDERSFPGVLYNFLHRLLELLPGVPLAVISPIYAGPHETQRNHVGLNVQEIRDWVHRVSESLSQEHGEDRIEVISGLEILGANDHGLLQSDNLHPSHHGYAHIAAKLEPRLVKAWNFNAIRK